MLSQDQGWEYVIQLMNGISHIKRIYSIRTINYPPGHDCEHAHNIILYFFAWRKKHISLLLMFWHGYCYCCCYSCWLAIFHDEERDWVFDCITSYNYEHCVNVRNIQYIHCISLGTLFLFEFSIIPKLSCTISISRNNRWNCYMNHNV